MKYAVEDGGTILCGYSGERFKLPDQVKVQKSSSTADILWDIEPDSIYHISKYRLMLTNTPIVEIIA